MEEKSFITHFHDRWFQVDLNVCDLDINEIVYVQLYDGISRKVGLDVNYTCWLYCWKHF